MSAEQPTAGRFLEELDALRSPEQLTKCERAFPVAQRVGDVFLGVAMGQVFALAKQYIDMPLSGIEMLLEDRFHEARVGAVSIMDFQARRKKTSQDRRQELFELYLRRHDRINTWDLVDRSAIHVVGGYLADRPRDVLYRLARSANTWERRTAIVSTLYFTGRGDTQDAFAIAELLLEDPEPLIHKATGWALRTAGGPGLLEFLDRHAATMPRAALRYAVEKLEQDRRSYYLGLKKTRPLKLP